MKNKTLIRAGLMAAIVLLGAYLLLPSLRGTGMKWSSKSTEDIPVLVATRFIPPFQALKPDQVRVRYYPREFVPPGALGSVADVRQENGQALFATIVGIPEGQPVTRAVLADANKERGMATLLRPGKVAVSFQVERSRAAGGWIHPGDTIAVFEKIPLDVTGRSTGKRQTRLLLSAVDVLAVDKAHVGGEEKPTTSTAPEVFEMPDSAAQTITVLTNTADAAAIIEAQEAGPLSVVLRAFGDDWPWTPR